jgi:hypothetical protein
MDSSSFLGSLAASLCVPSESVPADAFFLPALLFLVFFFLPAADAAAALSVDALLPPSALTAVKPTAAATSAPPTARPEAGACSIRLISASAILK